MTDMGDLPNSQATVAGDCMWHDRKLHKPDIMNTPDAPLPADKAAVLVWPLWQGMQRTLVSSVQLYSSSCGYCKHASSDDEAEEADAQTEVPAGSSVRLGMLVDAMTAGQYEQLMERGFRRSGKYLYQNQQACCCPQYAIRLEATAFEHTRVRIKQAESLAFWLCSSCVMLCGLVA